MGSISGVNANIGVVSLYGGPLNIDIDFKRRWFGRKAVLVTDHLPSFRTGHVQGLVLPIDSIDDIQLVMAERAESNARIVLVDSADDLATAIKESTFAVILAASYKAIGADPGKIAFLRNLGVRVFSLSTNRRNLLADGCGERMPGGLSHLGTEVVRELERHSILPDVSHLSDESFWDLLDNTTGPIVATHSNARGICDSPRNLSDAQIEAIADRNGLIGISTYPTLISDQNPSLGALLNHIDYICNLVGVEHVGIGTDFVGFMGDLMDSTLVRADPSGALYRKHEVNSVTPGIEGFSKVCNLVDGLAKRGYSNEELGLILSSNFIRLLDDRAKKPAP